MNREEETKEEVVNQIASGEGISRVLTDTEPGRLLQYTCKAPAAPEGYQNRLRVVYSQVLFAFAYNLWTTGKDFNFHCSYYY